MILACCCAAPSCVYTFAPTGCNGAPLPNATITFTPSVGSPISCTTSCPAGTCSVTLSPAASYTWAASHPRFNDAPTGSIGTGCPGPNTVAPAFTSVATNYYCIAGAASCGEPTPSALFVRSASQTGTITYAAGVWSGTLSGGDQVVHFDGGATMVYKVFLSTNQTLSLNAAGCCTHPVWGYNVPSVPTPFVLHVCEAGLC